jgi:predicted nucleotidyltransferase component of viral defense system
MLRTETVDSRTLALLKDLMQVPELKNFYLVGGTALSLQFGHRISIDLDFFGNSKFDFDTFVKVCESKFETIELKRKDSPIYQLLINDVKSDIVEYPYDLINGLIEMDGIRMASPQDIAAMKITAIGTRSTKKDFYDLYFLLENFHLSEIINFCELKFPNKDMFHYIRSLIYFDDVENDPEEVRLLKEVSWSKLKNRIFNEVRKLDI